MWWRDTNERWGLGQRLIIIIRPATGRIGVYCGDGR